MNRKVKILIFIQLLLFITSCATSQQGTDQLVIFSSNPSGASVKTSHGFSCSITPCKIKLPRNKSFEATISKPGFSTELVKVNSVPSGSGAVGALGSALIGGVLATGYDIYKGGVYELSPNEVRVKLQSTNAMVLEEIRGISNLDLFSN